MRGKEIKGPEDPTTKSELAQQIHDTAPITFGDVSVLRKMKQGDLMKIARQLEIKLPSDDDLLEMFREF